MKINIILTSKRSLSQQVMHFYSPERFKKTLGGLLSQPPFKTSKEKENHEQSTTFQQHFVLCLLIKKQYSHKDHSFQINFYFLILSHSFASNSKLLFFSKLHPNRHLCLFLPSVINCVTSLKSVFDFSFLLSKPFVVYL